MVLVTIFKVGVMCPTGGAVPHHWKLSEPNQAVLMAQRTLPCLQAIIFAISSLLVFPANVFVPRVGGLRIVSLFCVTFSRQQSSVSRISGAWPPGYNDAYFFNFVPFLHQFFNQLSAGRRWIESPLRTTISPPSAETIYI